MRGKTVGYVLRVLAATALVGSGAAEYFLGVGIIPQVMRFPHFPEAFMLTGGLLYVINALRFFRARGT